MSSKFEQLLDYLVNEEQEKANELFHEIVVEKSREIYENLIAEEEQEDEETTESTEDDEDESVEEGMGCDEEETVESMFGEEDEFPAQDQTDDLEGDIEADDAFGGDDFGGDDFGGEEGGDGSAPATKDDVQDLEDALEELKAEFEALLAQEEGEGHDMDAIDAAGDEADGEEGDDFGSEEEADSEEADDEEETMAEGKKSAGQTMREYIEKVAQTMTDGEGVGSGRGDKAGQTGHDNGKSPVSSGAGKPTSGANAKNIAQGGKGVGEMTGTSPNADKGGRGLVGNTKGEFTKAGTKNVASSANAKKPDGAKLSSVGKPGNKEFAGVGAATGGEKAGQTGSGDTKSPLTGAPNRAK
jgi:hypothetical protein